MCEDPFVSCGDGDDVGSDSVDAGAPASDGIVGAGVRFTRLTGKPDVVGVSLMELPFRFRFLAVDADA